MENGSGHIFAMKSSWVQKEEGALEVFEAGNDQDERIRKQEAQDLVDGERQWAEIRHEIVVGFCKRAVSERVLLKFSNFEAVASEAALVGAVLCDL